MNSNNDNNDNNNDNKSKIGRKDKVINLKPISMNNKNNKNKNNKNNKNKKIKKKVKIKVVKNNNNNTNTATNVVNNKDIGLVIPPEDWVSLDKRIFPSWINETFIMYQMTDNKKSSKAISGEIELYSYQKFIRDYLQYNSPYRGLLLYHGLGSGKTCSAIAIAERLKSEMDIVVMLPAALKNNFIVDGLKKCGDPKYRNKNTGDELIESKYSFISYNASNVIDQIKKIGSLDNKVVIIDEVHNLVSRMISPTSKTGRELYEMLFRAKNVKYVFLYGTPIINKMYEVGMMMNLLRGPIEVLNFLIPKKNKTKTHSQDLTDLEMVLSKMTNIIEYLEVNRVRDTIEIKLRIPSWHPEFNSTIDYIIDVAKENGIVMKLFRNEVNEYTLFPDDQTRGEEQFNQYFIKEGKKRGDFKLTNQNMFKRRTVGLISYVKNVIDETFPKAVIHPPVDVEMSDYQYKIYEHARQKEKMMEQMMSRKIKNPFMKMESKSSFSIYTRQICNFVFPEDISVRPQLDIKKDVKINAKTENGEQLNKEEKDAFIEKKKITETALNELSKNADVYLKPGPDGLNKYSPKMEKMLSMLNEAPGLVLIYSQFRSREGIELFARILNENGYQEYGDSTDKNTKNKSQNKIYGIYSGEEDQKQRQKTLEVFRSYENRDGSLMKALLITASGAEGLDLKNIREVYIMEPYWNEVRVEQVIGRAVRKNSHQDLPPEDRTVDVYRFFSVFTPEQTKKAVSNLKRERITTDQRIYEIAKIKKKLTDEVEDMMKAVAVDCTLNAKNNQLPFSCFTYGQQLQGKEEIIKEIGADEDSMGYIPDIRSNMVFGQQIQTQTVKKVYQPAVITKKGKIIYGDRKTRKYYYAANSNQTTPISNDDMKKLKQKLKVAIDLDDRKVYDYSSVVSKNPIYIGYYNDKSEYVKE